MPLKQSEDITADQLEFMGKYMTEQLKGHVGTALAFLGEGCTKEGVELEDVLGDAMKGVHDLIDTTLQKHGLPTTMRRPLMICMAQEAQMRMVASFYEYIQTKVRPN